MTRLIETYGLLKFISGDYIQNPEICVHICWMDIIKFFISAF